MRSQRIEKMEAYILERRTVTLDELCEEFQVSKNTVRRDLEVLLENRRFKKIYGGVTVEDYKELISFGERNIARLEEKQRIAEAAAALVEDGDVIFLDSGTTTLHMVEFLAARTGVTIVTNNVDALLRAIPMENLTVIALSGTLNRKTLSLTGPSSVQALQQYNIRKAFMATTGYSLASGVTNSSPLESDIKRTAVERSQQVFLLADSAKYGSAALTTYCRLEQIHGLVTDAPPPPEAMAFLEEHQIRLILA